MCPYDSPLAPCSEVQKYVATDQTQQDCARQHDCPAGRVCPLDDYFVKATGPAETGGNVERRYH